jgi:acyl-CoA reductase-like NAD-dependent aldehyde dehydrogenase
MDSYILGDPLEQDTMVGPVISAAAARSIQSQIDDALSKGATDCTPQNASFQQLPAQGSYIAPRLLINVDHTMAVMREETFGPLIPLQSVASDDKAVELMNESDYGLTASIWTKDIAKGEELTLRLDSGTAFVNRCDYPNPDLAWTGWKNSGLGCTLGPRGFDAFIKLKSYHIKQTHS